MSVLIAPSILSADFAQLGDEVTAVDQAGADLIHVDVMDGLFVPPITIGAPVVKDLRKVTSKPLDVHLMVREPGHLFESFAQAGTDFLTIHVEAVNHLDRALQQIRDLGMKAGVSLNPATPCSSVQWALEKADLVLVMSVNPGYGGQSFIDYSLRKIETLRRWIDRRGLPTVVEVDGGVKSTNIGQITAAGAHWVVAGSAVFNAPDYGPAIADLKRAAQPYVGPTAAD